MDDKIHQDVFSRLDESGYKNTLDSKISSSSVSGKKPYMECISENVVKKISNVGPS